MGKTAAHASLKMHMPYRDPRLGGLPPVHHFVDGPASRGKQTPVEVAPGLVRPPDLVLEERLEHEDNVVQLGYQLAPACISREEASQ